MFCDISTGTFPDTTLFGLVISPLRSVLTIAGPWDEGDGFELAELDVIRVTEPGCSAAGHSTPTPCRGGVPPARSLHLLPGAWVENCRNVTGYFYIHFKAKPEVLLFLSPIYQNLRFNHHIFVRYRF